MYYTENDIVKALNRVGIKKGDTVFFTTGLGMLGVPKINGLINSNNVSKLIFKSIKKVLSSSGTILIPTYSYSFKNSKKKLSLFNVKKTPSKIGPFGNYFLKQKGVIRSKDPMTSVAGLGKNAKRILENISPTSYGKNCVFERILNIKNSKCCSIGLGPNWMPFIHYCDWLNQVPFRYDKYFLGKIVNGKIKKRIIWHYPVRYLRKETFANGHKIGTLAVKKKNF